MTVRTQATKSKPSEEKLETASHACNKSNSIDLICIDENDENWVKTGGSGNKRVKSVKVVSAPYG